MPRSGIASGCLLTLTTGALMVVSARMRRISDANAFASSTLPAASAFINAAFN